MPINIQEIRFSGDTKLFNDCLANETIKQLCDKRLSERHDDSYRKRLLGNSLKISAKLSPKLHNMVSAAARKVGFADKQIEVYVYNSPEQNASCYYNGDERVILTFSSALLQSMNDDELNFVIGHELGHAVFKHSNLPSCGIAEDSKCTASDAMMLMSWSRRAEISADRMGLYVCNNKEAAISSFLKLSCGVSSPIIDFDMQEYSKQIQDLQALSTNLEDTSLCYASHPFNPIRVVAVNLYADSTHFIDSPDKARSFAEIDAEINDLLDFMEPVANEQKKALSDAFVMWAGVLVAWADGDFSSHEKDNLKEQVGEEKFNQYMAELNASDDMQTYAREQIEKLIDTVKTLSAPDCCSIIQRLVVVARADQEIHSQERAILEEMASKLSVDSTFINQILLFL